MSNQNTTMVTKETVERKWYVINTYEEVDRAVCALMEILGM